MKNNVVKSIARNGLIAAIYFLLTFLTSPFSFMGIQIRIAEAMILLCFFRRDYAIGLTLVCLIKSLSPIGLWDALFGSIATLVSCILVSCFRHLFLATLIPVIINGFVVGAELFLLLEEPFWFNFFFVALGEFIAVSVLGYAIFMIFGKKEYFQQAMGPNGNFNLSVGRQNIHSCILQWHKC